jgi:hypothetical protein
MKYFFYILMALTPFSALQAQEQAVAQAPAPVKEDFQFRETEYDFGRIPQGKPVYYYFEVKNTGSVPLKIDQVTASCGCTTPEWDKAAVPAGGTTRIKVGYNAASEGNFDKYITVIYNGNVQKQIKIKGNVWKAPAGAAPANASVQFLKQQIQ